MDKTETSRTSYNGHLSITATFSADIPYIDSCLNLFKAATLFVSKVAVVFCWEVQLYLKTELQDC